MEFRSSLARARGLGAAHHGFTHWWRQRISAIVLIPTGLWLAVALSLLPDASYEGVRHWIARPVNTILLVIYLGGAFFHATLGLQVIMEDYISTPVIRITSILVAKGLLALTALMSLYAVLQIAMGN
jgi:succinate dehydrogenase / fumarate reductase membrane anchor subunit